MFNYRVMRYIETIKESINQQDTAGTFGRPVSSYEWHF